MAEAFAALALADEAEDGKPDAQDAALVSALRRGDEAAFMFVVDEYHATMIRVASLFVSGQAAAEDVVQDVWLSVIRGIAAFQGRSSLKTWMFRILTNRAKSAGQRQGRTVPVAVLPGLDWRTLAPTSMPEYSILMEDSMNIVRAAIDELPKMQRKVITLRDVEGCGAAEVCELLQLTTGNQRVLLHRARARVRQCLQGYHERVEDSEAG